MILLPIILLLSLCASAQAQAGISTRAGSSGPSPISFDKPIETHHSLHIPLDKTQVYWNYGGSTVMSEQTIRLTPSVGDSKGWIWNEYPLESSNWEVEFSVEIGSKGHFGGEGFAMWVLAGNEDPSFTQKTDALTGPVFGMKSDFRGFGICVDVYDNDIKRNNPSVFVLHNPTGSMTNWQHDLDYEPDMVKVLPKNTLDSQTAQYKCIADLRNTGRIARFVVKFLHNILHVYVDTTNSNSFKYCLSVELEGSFKDYHLAFSAATGQVADRHDLKEVITRYLDATDKDFDDSTLAQLKGGAASTGFSRFLSVWLLINLFSIVLIGIIAVQLMSYLNSASSRIDPVQICHKDLNPWVLPHYATHGIIGVLLLLGGQWLALLLNLPMLGWKVFEFTKKTWLFSPSSIGPAKGHAAGKISVTMKLGGTLAYFVVLEIYYLYRYWSG